MRQLAIIILLAVTASAAEPAKSPPERAAPPIKWDSRVTDVFLPDARTALVGQRPDWMTVGMLGTGDAKGNATGGAGGAKSGASATGSFAWSKLISVDTLQDEIKSLQPQ